MIVVYILALSLSASGDRQTVSYDQFSTREACDAALIQKISTFGNRVVRISCTAELVAKPPG